VDTPWIAPLEIDEIGFQQVSFPANLILRVVAAMRDGVEALRRHADGSPTLCPLPGHARCSFRPVGAIEADRGIRPVTERSSPLLKRSLNLAFAAD
jgi:hypothetical protein